MKARSELTEDEVIRLLNRLDRNWPEGYTLFSWSGTLCLLRNSDLPSGITSLTNGHTVYQGSYNDAVIWTSSRIVNDGGDPD